MWWVSHTQYNVWVASFPTGLTHTKRKHYTWNYGPFQTRKQAQAWALHRGLRTITIGKRDILPPYHPTSRKYPGTWIEIGA